MNTGVQKELVTHIRDYDYETICGSVGSDFPEEYEIPRGNTGTLKNQIFGDCVAKVISSIAENFYSKEMSDGFIYGAFRKDSSASEGMILSVAMDMWTKIGTVPKKYFDVSAEMPEIKAIVNKYPELYDIASKYKLKGYVNIRYNKQKRDLVIKDALTKFKYGLVAASNKGFAGGGHCIQLTGWNDKNDKYKYKNSRGENFGDKGFSEIDKSKIDFVYLPIFEEVKMPFTDVKKTDWFYEDVQAMYSAGLIKGTTETTFEPNKPITRAEVCALFNRFAKELEKHADIINKVVENEDLY